MQHMNYVKVDNLHSQILCHFMIAPLYVVMAAQFELLRM